RLAARPVAPQARGAVVGVQVPAAQPRHEAPAVDVAAGDRAADGVRVLDDRHGHELRGRWDLAAAERTDERVAALVGAPTEAGPARGRQADVVDLLVAVLPDIADPEVAGLLVEGEAPGVAQAEAVDLRRRVRLADEGVRRRDPVRPGAVDVDPQDL